LWLDGRDLRSLPLIERKANLERIVPSGSRRIYARHIDGDGTGVFDVVCHEDLQGVVGKLKQGPYLDGRDRNTTWVKVKNPNYSHAVGRDDLFARRARKASAAAV
jgi:bifunctional non-homologous end joining protein LigD